MSRGETPRPMVTAVCTFDRWHKHRLVFEYCTSIEEAKQVLYSQPPQRAAICEQVSCWRLEETVADQISDLVISDDPADVLR